MFVYKIVGLVRTTQRHLHERATSALQPHAFTILRFLGRIAHYHLEEKSAVRTKLAFPYVT